MAKNFLVPPSEVYKRGPYLHSNAQEFLNNNLNFSEAQDQEYLNKLREHLSIAEEIERQFYTDLGVKDADDFSNQFLYGFDGQNQGHMEKTIQKILISASSSYALIANPNRKSIEDALAEVAEELINGLSTTDKKAFDAIVNAGMDAAVDRVQQLMEYLNANQGKSSKAFKLKKGQKITVSFPKGQLSSKMSKYIIDLLVQIKPEIKDQLRADANKKIENYKEFFINSAEQEGLDWDTIQTYWGRVEKKLKQLLKNEDSDDSGNMAAFFNPLGAEGALGEIAIILSFEDILTDKGTVQQLANDLIKAERLEYNTSKGVVVKKNKYGENIVLKYKSPTDMIITVGEKVYTFQIKTSYSSLSPDKVLKLQNSIQLQTLLGNLVSGGFMSDDSAKMFIYTIVNLSTKEIFEHEGADEKIALACRMLQMCLEYFAESRYAKNLSEVLDSKNLSSNTNAGNMFFIYSGKLIPISHFIKAAIASLEGKQLINILPYKNMVKYGRQYSTRFIGREHTIEGRIQLGQGVYENTKLTELGFYIGQLEQYIRNGIY